MRRVASTWLYIMVNIRVYLVGTELLRSLGDETAVPS